MTRNNYWLAGLGFALAATFFFNLGSIYGHQQGKEAIIELLSKYKCEGHKPMPGGVIECTLWVRRTDADHRRDEAVKK